MEDQVPEEVVGKRFDRLLHEIQKISAELTKEREGKIETALVEEINAQSQEFVTGRLSNNLLVHFKGDASLIGKLVSVKLKESKGFYYIGELA